MSCLNRTPTWGLLRRYYHSHVIEYLQQLYPCSAVSAAGTTVQFESGGELLHAIREFPDKFQPQIVVVNVDTLITLPLQRLVDVHRRNPGSLTLALTRLPGVPNENAMWIAPDGRILYNAELDNNPMSPDEASPRTLYRASSAGALVVDIAFLRQIDWTPDSGQVSLYRGIMELAVRMQEAYGYDNGLNPFMDVGTVSTWQAVAANPQIIDAYLRYIDA